MFVLSGTVVLFCSDGFEDQSTVGSGQNQTTLRVVSAEYPQNMHSSNGISDNLILMMVCREFLERIPVLKGSDSMIQVVNSTL
jgi:hypothetical protein